MASALQGPLQLVGSSATRIPALVYGSAWKTERTADLVYQALRNGFRAVDTAAQPKHYREDLVGDAIRQAIRDGIVKREELYLQTKFTPVRSQDPNNMPYNPAAPLVEQVKTSLASSLANFKTADTEPYIDCLVLHSPFPTSSENLTAWRLLESYVPTRIRALGISNVSLPALEWLWSNAHVKPAVVQNRFQAENGYDSKLRRWCRERGVVFQSFWTLKKNPRLLSSAPSLALGREAGVGEVVALYSLILGLAGTVMLDGTTREEHMREDLEGVRAVGEWMKVNPERWGEIIGDFRALVGDGK